MDRITKRRGPIRTTITRYSNKIEEELTKAYPDKVTLVAHFTRTKENLKEVMELDQLILDGMLDEEFTDEELNTEREVIESYREKVEIMRVKINEVICPVTKTSSPPLSSASLCSRDSLGASQNNCKLPKIELQRFNGELLDWLGFWAQFQKIHDDNRLHPTDKFHYLLQSMEKGTRGKDLVESYPPTADNYPKAVEALKERFGKEGLLIQVYVSELLKLVIANNMGEKSSVAKLHDRLEAHLRALESLGVTSDQTAMFLFPMVESSISEELFVAWQRSPTYGIDGSKLTPPKSELDLLMEFLKKEVLHEDQRALVQTGFTNQTSKENRNISGTTKKKILPRNEIPSAAGLFAGQTTCIFCEKSHDSKDCIIAPDLTLEERKAAAKAKRSCYICLRHGHMAKACRATLKCLLCKRKHATIMCAELTSDKHKQSENKSVQEKEEPTKTWTMNIACSSSVALQTLMMKVSGSKGEKTVRALLDSGSQRSYILRKIVDELGLPIIGQEVISHSLFGGTQTSGRRHRRIHLTVHKVNGRNSCQISVLDQEKICGDIPRMQHGPWMKALKENKIWITDIGEGCPEIDILLGADVMGDILTGKLIRLGEGLTAIETILGWTILGKGPQRQQRDSVAMNVTSLLSAGNSLSDLWKLETIGINDPVEIKAREIREREIQQNFSNTVSQNDQGRYCVGLPWIEGHHAIPDNKQIAEKRLMSVTRKLLVADRYLEYDDIFESWLKEDIIEDVHRDFEEHECHYLPHRAVYKPESLTTPVRPVFDASAKTGRAPSLNDCLEKGPNLLEVIPAVLLRFREGKIGLISDIRKAFQMIEVRESDRDFLRFLWWENPTRKKLRTFRHKRVVFGVNCSPFLLGAVIEYHLTKIIENPESDCMNRETAKKLLKSLYVDNCVTSVDSLQEYEQFKEKATTLMAQGAMDLRQWSCSYSSSEENQEANSGESDKTSVLGLQWDKRTDNLSYGFSIEEPSEEITKRDILSQVQKVYDPLGFLGPALITPKKLLQEAWLEKLGWDERLSEKARLQYHRWLNDLRNMKIEIPRNMTGGLKRGDNFQIHTFVDASIDAYAAAVFLRTKNEERVSVHLMQAKNRIAPLKKPTIPRLELLACSIGARLASSIKESLQLSEVEMTFWSDSTTALAWIRRNDVWGTFVGNRVKEILQLTDVKAWRHVSGTLNPADLPSRGCSPSQLVNSRWWEGPKWLLNEPETWPGEPETQDKEAIDRERKQTVVSLATVEPITTKPWYMISGDYMCNIRIIAWIKRFIANTRGSVKQTKRYLSLGEVKSAEETVTKLIQRETLSINKDVVSGIRVLTDERGCIRVKTKILNRPDTYGFRYPVLLPHSHPLVEQLILNEHRIYGHAGIQFIITHLREIFWILQGRRLIRRVLKGCTICNRFTAKKPEVMPSALPEDRVKNARVFEIVGVDLAGPLFVRKGNKVWIALFTCAVYRCVHLELVTALSTDEFLEAFERFISRRGRPSTVYSDNGTNFVGAVNLFKNLNWEKIVTDVQLQRIEWKFNPPTAAWWGGWWERLVRSMKDLLKRILGKSRLDLMELQTVLCRVEAVINGRPLTCVTEDPDDLIPLTPAMFLQEIDEVRFPEKEELDARGFQKRFQYRQKIRDAFRDRFRKEYLGLMVQNQSIKTIRSMKEGDLVFVASDNKRRWEWPKGRIIELFPGKDGHIRVARVKTEKGEYLRPVQRLYPMEVSAVQDIPQTTRANRKKVIGNSTYHKAEWDDEQSKKTNVDVTHTRSGRAVGRPERFGDWQ